MTEMGPNANKQKAFEAAIKHLNGKKGILETTDGLLIAKLGDRPMNVDTVSTGSLVLDSILGGGFPVGRVIEIYGPEASGKTSIALTAVGNVQKGGGTAAFVDLENALDPRYARKLGVDIDNLAVAQPDSAEQALQLVEELANSGALDIVVIDSVAALVPKLELEGDMDQNSIGLVARLMSRSLKKLVSTANRTKTTIIFINQTRDAIGGYSPVGTPQTTTGGKALKFFASQRIDVRRRQQVKDGKDVIGNEVRFKVVKNKIAPPFGEGVTVLTFNKGINKAAEMIEVGPDYGVITKPNSRTYIVTATQEKIASSKADAVAALEANPELYNFLAAELTKVLDDSLSELPERAIDNPEAEAEVSSEESDFSVEED
jgi:recombination protein RecA